MPLDYSIPLQFQVRQTDPLQQAAQMLSLRDVMDAAKMRQFQFEQAQKDVARAESWRQAVGQNNMQTAMRIDPKATQALLANIQEQKQAQATFDKTKAEAAKLKYDAEQRQYQVILDGLRGTKDQASLDYNRARLKAQGLLTPEMEARIPVMYNPRWVAEMTDRVMSLQEQLAAQKAQAEVQEAQFNVANQPTRRELLSGQARSANLDAAQKAREAAERAANPNGLTNAENAQLQQSGQNPNNWLAIVNSPTATPEQKAIAQKNLDGSAAQSQASAPVHHSLIMGPFGSLEGAGIFNPKTGVTTKAPLGEGMDPDAGRIASSVPREVRDAVASADTITSMVSSVRGSINAIKSKMGPAWGRIANVQLGKLGGYGLDAETQNALLEMANLFVGKGFDAAGKNLTANEMAAIRKTLPEASDTPTVALRKLEILERTVNSVKTARLGTLTERQQRLLQGGGGAAAGTPTRSLDQIFGR